MEMVKHHAKRHPASASRCAVVVSRQNRRKSNQCHQMNYWLMKSGLMSSASTTSRRCPAGTEHWDGVRNYQARNMMRDQMKKGDLVFFYHSNCDEPGIVGIMEIARKAIPITPRSMPTPSITTRRATRQSALVYGRREVQAPSQAQHLAA